jgi:hypothetical protein
MRRDVSALDRLRAVQRGVREALREHALLGHSVSVWRDGRIVRLSPAEILAELEAERVPGSVTESDTTK